MFFKRAPHWLWLMVFAQFPTACVASDSTHWHGKKDTRPSITDAVSNGTYRELNLMPHEEKNREKTEGSIWNESYTSRLYDNMYRASRVGDTVMIVVAEASSALGSGSTKANKKTDHKASIDALGNVMTKLSKLLTGLNPANLISGKTESKFQGEGETQRKGNLQAKISATVTHVLPNGNMVVRGDQHIKMNAEEQVLTVEGIIRPYDILPNNTVLSSSLADARIGYRGFGVVAEKQKPGWLVRVLDYIWPF